MRSILQRWFGLVYWITIYLYLGPPLPGKSDYLSNSFFWSLTDSTRVTIILYFIIFIGWPYFLGAIAVWLLITFLPGSPELTHLLVLQFVFGLAISVCGWRYIIARFTLTKKMRT